MSAVLAVLVSALAPQAPTAPASSPQQRYVDFSDELDRPALLVALGTLEKLKEGRRQRLPDGVLGGPGQSVSVGGTQFYKVPVTTRLQVRKVLVGDAGDKVALQFDLQVARLPDGSERRQVTTGNRAGLAEGTLALWVVAPQPKGKPMELLHVIPFDPAADKGDDPQAVFGDTMRDFVAVNQRVHDLKRGIAALEQAEDEAARAKARDALQAVVDTKLELLCPRLHSLLSSQVWPYEKRARDRLGAPGREAGK